MRKPATETFKDPVVRGVVSLTLAGAACAALLWMTAAYLDPGLRKAIIFGSF